MPVGDLRRCEVSFGQEQLEEGKEEGCDDGRPIPDGLTIRRVGVDHEVFGDVPF